MLMTVLLKNTLLLIFVHATGRHLMLANQSQQAKIHASSHADVILPLNQSSAVDMNNHRMEKYPIYTQRIKLLEDYYGKQKKLLDVQVICGLYKTWQGLLTALNLLHMDNPSPSKNLTA